MRFSYLIYIALAFALFAVVPTASADEVWLPPDDCAPEDRVRSGNLTTPCRYPSEGNLTDIEYVVHYSYPQCVEVLIFRIEGVGPFPEDSGYKISYVEVMRTDGTGDRVVSNQGFWGGPYHAVLGNNGIVLPGDIVTRDSSILPDGVFDDVFPNRPLAYMKFDILNEDGYQEAAFRTNAVPYPAEVGSRSSMINNCLASVEQEDARRVAATQATIAAQELIQLQAARAQVMETEIIKTQALRDEIAHQEAKAAILQEIARIRLAGEGDRARILNEYLTRARASAAEFDAETGEIEAAIDEYIAFNEALLIEIEGYQTALRTQVESLQAQLAEQEAALAELSQEPE